MDTHDNDPLIARLRALPAERQPAAAVWERIAAGLEHSPREAGLAALPVRPRIAPAPVPVPLRRRQWPWLMGVAAAVLALVGAVNLWLPQPTVAASPLQAQADAMTSEYHQAIAAIPRGDVPAELQPALREIDASASRIRSAIDQSPQAGFLLGQLQRTYALRLELTRQGLGGAGLST